MNDFINFILTINNNAYKPDWYVREISDRLSWLGLASPISYDLFRSRNYQIVDFLRKNPIEVNKDFKELLIDIHIKIIEEMVGD